MTSLGWRVAVAAILAGASADLAAADSISIAEGTHEGDRVRIVAGEIDSKGFLYAEYYAGAALRFAVPIERAFVDGEETSIRSLRDLRVGKQGADGFAFTAAQGTVTLQCTALMWGDSTANCTRDPRWTPPGSPECAAAFKSNTERFQCNGLRDHFASPAIAHDELLRTCSASFRWESFRTECLRYGYNAPTDFHDKLAACTAAYRTEHERRFCTFYSFAPAQAKDRPSPAIVRECDRLHDDDKQTTDCVFLKHTGVKQVHPKSKEWLPTHDVTAPLALPASRTESLEVTAGGTFQDLALRAIGGVVDNEPILIVDATKDMTVKWSQVIDRIVLGKRTVRAFREVSAIDRIKLAGDVLTFRVVHDGKKLACRANATTSYAWCK